MADSAVKILTDDNFEKEIAKGVVLVDFHALWCGPCRMMTPVVEQVAKHFEGKAVVAKLDIDVSVKSASKYSIYSVPTLILFKDGKEVNRVEGLRDSETLLKMINSSL